MAKWPSTGQLLVDAELLVEEGFDDDEEDVDEDEDVDVDVAGVVDVDVDEAALSAELVLSPEPRESVR